MSWYEHEAGRRAFYNLPELTPEQIISSLKGELKSNHALFQACEQALKEEQARSAELQAELEVALEEYRRVWRRAYSVRYWVDSLIQRVRYGVWPKI